MSSDTIDNPSMDDANPTARTPTSGAASEVDRRWILLTRVIVVLHRLIDRAAQDGALTIAQYRFLLTLKRGPRRASVLATLAGIGRPTASALVMGMEKRGLIERYADPDDGRAEMLRLTEPGLARYADFERLLAQELSDYLDIEDRSTLLDRLEELAHFIDHKGARSVVTPTLQD